MLKGFVKADEDSAAWALLGVLGGLAVQHAAGHKMGKVGPGIAAGMGAATALGVRAFVDPELISERKAV